MSIDERERPPIAPTCPMCGKAVGAGAPALVEQGETIHLGCHLGLMDAGAAIAGLLREHPGQPLCVACIAGALGITSGEAHAGSARLRSLKGFQTRLAVCLGCGGRRQVLRALRSVGRRFAGESRTA